MIETLQWIEKLGKIKAINKLRSPMVCNTEMTFNRQEKKTSINLPQR